MSNNDVTTQTATSPQAQTQKEEYLRQLQVVMTLLVQWNDINKGYPDTAAFREYGPGGANELTEADCLNTIGVNLFTVNRSLNMISEIQKFFNNQVPEQYGWQSILDSIRSDR